MRTLLRESGPIRINRGLHTSHSRGQRGEREQAREREQASENAGERLQMRGPGSALSMPLTHFQKGNGYIV